MKLKLFRQMLGLSQARAGELLGVSELSVINYESGRTIPSRQVMRSIYQWSNGSVSPDDFYNLEDLPMSNPVNGISTSSKENAALYIGLMSGTSMDGIDAALLMTDGRGYIHPIGSTSFEYERAFHDQLKALERSVKEAEGDCALARKNFNQFDQIVESLTRIHGDVVDQLLKKTKYQPRAVRAIGFHGQTLFHRPAKKITVQVGDGQRLANQTGIEVVYDFRSNDVAHGGQGAPFAPLYHQALALQSGLAPVVIANCGGISNITVITGADDQLFAFDPGPGNGLIDRLVKERVGKLMDQDGAFGLQGVVSDQVLKELHRSALLSSEGENYLDRLPPKSLDISDLSLIKALGALSLQDACATLEAFTADCIVESLRFLEARGIVIPRLWVLAGGGWNNPVIVRELESRLSRRLGAGIKIQRAEQVGWDGKALEAQIFAYLAARTIGGLPLSVPGTTGVPEPLTGGVLVSPEKMKREVAR